MADSAQPLGSAETAEHLQAHSRPSLHMLHAAAHAGYVPKQHQQRKEQGGIERPAEEYLDALRQQVLIRYNEACAPEKGCKGGGAKAITSRKKRGKSDLHANAPVVEAVHLVLNANQNEIVLGVHIKKPFLNRPDSIVHNPLSGVRAA